MKKLLSLSTYALAVVFLLSSCSKKERSATTGWKYNDKDYGGFEKLDYEGQDTGPNLVLIEGGTFTMGVTGEDVTYDWNNTPRRVTVSSFYMDETEVANIDYREYTFWMNRVFSEDYEFYLRSLPDTLVWREELAYNEPLVKTYFRHPSFDDYPVVGVSWVQAAEYSKWRTDRVNENRLIEEGILNPSPEQKGADNFNTGSYLAGYYQGNVRKNLKNIATGEDRSVRFEDGILLPDYRLPTEAEWEYAALGLIGNMISDKDEIISDRRIYPWNGNSVRYQTRDRYQGQILANFKRGAGDYMGIAGNLNDNAAFPAPVRSFLPNDYGLYNMAGNVNEWVFDLYRPLTSVTLRDVENQDLNPVRGGTFREIVTDEFGRPAAPDSLGRLPTQPIEDASVAGRENYKRGEVYNYLDGDQQSQSLYEYGKHTLISDETRVYKGGSWSDRAYWLSPGTRRFKDQNSSDRNLGFRCAMIRLGGANGNDEKGGNQFGSSNSGSKKRSRRGRGGRRF